MLNENQAAAVAGEPVIEEDTELTVEQENNPAFVFNQLSIFRVLLVCKCSRGKPCGLICDS